MKKHYMFESQGYQFTRKMYFGYSDRKKQEIFVEQWIAETSNFIA